MVQMKIILMLKAYYDSKCCYGYMLLCDKCYVNRPRFVGSEPIQSPTSGLHKCEMCKRKGVVL